jgi:hypothetical protein
MTRKDYVLIAVTLRAAKPGIGAPSPAFTQWFYDVDSITNMLSADNPRFDRIRFELACAR